ncbi:hypothetical protein Pelo_9137 [Pelomyxa schiedti]|nr:hypothetical protein Pelo_9137 [Pelomyxa schiedti]
MFLLVSQLWQCDGPAPRRCTNLWESELGFFSGDHSCIYITIMIGKDECTETSEHGLTPELSPVTSPQTLKKSSPFIPFPYAVSFGKNKMRDAILPRDDMETNASNEDTDPLCPWSQVPRLPSWRSPEFQRYLEEYWTPPPTRPKKKSTAPHANQTQDHNAGIPALADWRRVSLQALLGQIVTRIMKHICGTTELQLVTVDFEDEAAFPALGSVCAILGNDRLTVGEVVSRLKAPLCAIGTRVIQEAESKAKLIDKSHSLVVIFEHTEVLWTPFVVNCTERMLQSGTLQTFCPPCLYQSFVFPLLFLTLRELSVHKPHLRLVFSSGAPLFTTVVRYVQVVLPNLPMPVVSPLELLCPVTVQEIRTVIQSWDPPSDAMAVFVEQCLEGPISQLCTFEPATEIDTAVHLVIDRALQRGRELECNLQNMAQREVWGNGILGKSIAAQQLALLHLLPEAFGAAQPERQLIGSATLGFTPNCRILTRPIPDYWDLFSISGLVQFSRQTVQGLGASYSENCTKSLIPINYGLMWMLDWTQCGVVFGSLPEEWLTWTRRAFVDAIRCFWRTPGRLMCKVLAVALSLRASPVFPGLIPVRKFHEVDDLPSVDSLETDALYFLTRKGSRTTDFITSTQVDGKTTRQVKWCTTRKKDPQEKYLRFKSSLENAIGVFVHLHPLVKGDVADMCVTRNCYTFQFGDLYFPSLELFCHPIAGSEINCIPPVFQYVQEYCSLHATAGAKASKFNVDVNYKKRDQESKLGTLPVPRHLTLLQLCHKSLLKFGHTPEISTSEAVAFSLLTPG